MGSVLEGPAPQSGAPSTAMLSGAALSDAELDESYLSEAAAGEAVFGEEGGREAVDARGQVGQSGFFGRFLGASSVPSSEDRDAVAEALDEVQSLNEGLQHANDALHAANAELRAKLAVLRRTTLDLGHMLDDLELGVVLLDEELVLLQFNAMAAQFLALDVQDVGDPVATLCGGLGPLLETWCNDVSRSGRRAEHACRSTIGEPLRLRIRSARVEGAERLILVFAEAAAE
jgi:hypothetical protein